VASRAFYRTVLMYGFHLLVVLLVSGNVRDTQCGFKLFNRATARILFALMHLDRWSFDVELIYLAEALEIPLIEVYCRTSFNRSFLMFWLPSVIRSP
jgi:dolichyl-phosphate beta-glucosyltransferase